MKIRFNVPNKTIFPTSLVTPNHQLDKENPIPLETLNLVCTCSSKYHGAKLPNLYIFKKFISICRGSYTSDKIQYSNPENLLRPRLSLNTSTPTCRNCLSLKITTSLRKVTAQMNLHKRNTTVFIKRY